MKLGLLFRTALLWACALTVFGVQATVDKVELDGNVVKQTTLDDWQNINLGTSMANVTTGVIDDLPPATIFWKGGSKDTQDVTEWWYKDGSVPDKDDLRNGYAAAYFIDNGAGSDDLVFYFGAERYANNGDAVMGFWFFQDKVGTGPNNRFTGQHQENDLFIIMEYPQDSNSVPFVQVMRWVNSGGDVAENLELLYASGNAGAKCLTAGDSGIACAITNETPELAGVANGLWPYENKEGIANTYPYESFFEGRLNVSKAFAEVGITEIPCFSSFLIETRSSRSETAQLKDFLGGDFPLCSIAITKTCGATELTGSNQFRIDYTLTLTNTGVGSIGSGETVTIDDSPSDGTAFSVSQDVSAFANGADGWSPNEMLTYSGYYISNVNGGTNTVDASVSFGSASIDADQYTATCDSLALSPMLSIVKNCSVSLEETGGVVALRKDYDITVCNTGDAPLDVTLTDSVDTNLNAAFSLDFAKQCLTDSDCGSGYSCDTNTLMCTNTDGDLEGNFGGDVCNVTTDNYLPSTLPTGSSGTLSNTATAKATSPVVDTGDLATIGNSDTASCDLCPLPVPEQ
ncbi:hypothetical protein HR45_05325 [Shewanella mangrovi]|uniref:DUF11 domain-containing protein n=1 Tax=Shewanella mangrovi TaxID=1515746 RepID=A0A094JI14_9GAMM|nr:hypothetical protein [Shewanella mangrovi]KFZ38827.1 hypothetical protein HR45_05325 [Shewanella mangrovi]